jgi:hypothetical protein
MTLISVILHEFDSFNMELSDTFAVTLDQQGIAL